MPLSTARRGVDDVADLLEVLALEVVEALARDAGVDARAQQDRAERLGQVVVGAELDAAHDAVGLLDGGDHDHRQVAQGGVRADALEHLVAVELGHEHVEQDDVERRAAVQQLPARAAVVGGRDRVAEALEVAGQQPAVDRVVVDDQQPGPACGCGCTLRPWNPASRSPVWTYVTPAAFRVWGRSRRLSSGAAQPEPAESNRRRIPAAS